MADGDGVAEFKGRADGQHKFAHARGVGIAQFGGVNPAALILITAMSDSGIDALDFAVKDRPSLKRTMILSAFSTT